MITSNANQGQAPSIRTNAARIGAYPGFALTALSALGGVSFEGTSLASWIAPVAITVGMIVGWWHAPHVVAAPRWPSGRLLLMGFEATTLGLVMMAVLGGIGTPLGSPALDGIAAFATGAAFVALFGLLLFGLPMVVVATAAAFVWAEVLRRRYPLEPLQ